MDIATMAEAIAIQKFGDGTRTNWFAGCGRPFAIAVLLAEGGQTDGKIVAIAAGDLAAGYRALISAMLRPDPNPTTPEVCAILGVTDVAVRHQMLRGRLTRLTEGNSGKPATWDAESVGRRAIGMTIAREIMEARDKREGETDAQRLHDKNVVALAKAAGIELIEESQPGDDREHLVGPGFGQEV